MINVDQISKDVITLLKPCNPEQIILFGSHAWGNSNDNSDIDLYIVTNDDTIPKNWKEKSAIYLKISKALTPLTSRIPVDLIVHTKKMNKKFIKINSAFARKIMTQGKILYES